MSDQHARSVRKPCRIRLRRVKGWRKPEGAVVCTRPGRYGNPFRVEWVHGWRVQGCGRTVTGYPSRDDAAADAVRLYREIVAPALDLSDLRGKDLCCFCALDEPCHVDVILELANQ